VDFSLNLERGILRGKIDLMYLTDDGRLCLIDHKTDSELRGIVGRYRAQLLAYAYAARRIVPRIAAKGVQVGLYMARTGEVLPVEYSEKDEVWLMRLVDSLCDALECSHARRFTDCFPKDLSRCATCWTKTKQACSKLG